MQEWIQVSTPGLPLTPLMLPWMMRALRQPTLGTVLREYGSPLHIVNTSPFASNINAFGDVARAHGVSLRTYYARKCCRSRAFVSEAIRLGIGLDCASFAEVTESLRLGASGTNMVLTSPMLSEELAQLVVGENILTVVDSEADLMWVSAVAKGARRKLPILLRVSGFSVDGLKLRSRFGFDADALLAVVAQMPRDLWKSVALRGLHFHLDGYTPQHRSVALLRLQEMILELRRLGHNVEQVNIGGGFLVCYLASAGEWQSFLAAHQAVLLHGREPFWFGEDAFGSVRMGDGSWTAPRLYPFQNSLARGEFFAAVLNEEQEGVSVRETLQRLGVTIGIEPGRASVDQCGMTIARFGGTKTLPWQRFSSLEMNHTHLKAVSAEYCVDPLFGPQSTTGEGPVTSTLVGDYCMESDVIIRRHLCFPQPPVRGDLIAFPNTAGYMMHLFESPGHRARLPQTIGWRDDVKEFVSDA